jgi:hypothetical protein
MRENNMDKEKKMKVSFAAIDKYYDSNIVLPTETLNKTKGFMSWGTCNDYPQYLRGLYYDVPTLHSIIDGMADYVAGEGTTSIDLMWDTKENNKGQTLYDTIKLIAKDLCMFNGFALNVIKDKSGNISDIYWLDFAKVRSNEDGTKLYYSTDWGKKSGRVSFIQYDSFTSNVKENPDSTIFYWKNDYLKVYPTPVWGAAVLPCEIEKKINIYHYNLIDNGMSSNYIVNFNNGVPTDEIKEEIENDFYDKFCGVENTGRPMLSFNDKKDNEVTVTKIDGDNYADRWHALYDTTKQQIFTAFRCSPLLFGIDQEKTGFNANEYQEAYALFNQTMIIPMQKDIEKAFDKIFNTKNFVKITPFNINISTPENE